MQPDITGAITIPETASDSYQRLNPIFATGHDDEPHQSFRLRLARIVLVVLVILSARVMSPLAQDPQSQTLEQWLVQLKDPDAAKRRQAIVALGSFGPDLTKAMIRQVGRVAQGCRSGGSSCGRALDR